MNRRGYLIVLMPAVNVDRFENAQFVRDSFDLYREFRQNFSMFDPRQYRGISREPLDGYLSTEERHSSNLVENGAARFHFSNTH